MVAKEYTLYETGQLGVPCSFLYPTSWKVREILEDEYAVAFIGGPRSEAGTFTLSLAAASFPQSDQTLDEAVSSFLSKYHTGFGCRVLGQARGTVAGRPAVEVEIAYSMLLPLNKVYRQPTTIRERHIFLKRDDQLFELSYSAPNEDYATWLDAFRIFAQTFSFSQRDKEMTFHPFVAGVAIDTAENSNEKEGGEKPQ